MEVSEFIRWYEGLYGPIEEARYSKAAAYLQGFVAAYGESDWLENCSKLLNEAATLVGALKRKGE